MIIQRKEPWGILRYDTIEHRFSRVEHSSPQSDAAAAIPYTQKPVLLNVYLTMTCNMDCSHCVTKDFGETVDLVVSTGMINWLKKSPFMVLVITGGEPLIPEYEKDLVRVLRQVRRKGLILDTNGTIFPSRALIKSIVATNTLVRVSWDSTRPDDEIYLRHVKPYFRGNRLVNLEAYYKKEPMIKRLASYGVKIAIQSVLHKKNVLSILNMPEKLAELPVKQWYIQRFIPSYRAADKRNLEVDANEYDMIVGELIRKSREQNIECIAKRDRRHNSVFMLVGDGGLYTQGESPGQKIPLGRIETDITYYFEYVSSSEHSHRYYG